MNKTIEKITRLKESIKSNEEKTLINRLTEIREKNGSKLITTYDGDSMNEFETQEEIDNCKERVTIASKDEFGRDKTEDIVDGISFLVVGLILWVSFGIWGKRTNKKEGYEE